jgi:general secretion pathway protein D
VREIRSTAGTLTYQVGTRNASTALRLRNGETQALAGLINDEDRRSASRLPGLGDLPIVGRLFSSERNEKVKTEIVLLITPRIVRNLPRPEFNVAEFTAGTENAAGAEPLGIRPAAAGALRLSTTAPGGATPFVRPPPRGSAAQAVDGAVGVGTAGASPEALSVVLSGSSTVAPGAELGVGVSVPAGAQRGEITLAFDASIFSEVRASGAPAGEPGRIVFRLEQANDAAATFSARLKAVNREVTASALSVESVSLRDATGRELPVTIPPAIQVSVAP